MSIEIKESPILFSGDMVQAILEGRKTQTRRVIKNVFSHVIPGLGEFRDCIVDVDGLPCRLDIAPNNWELCPYGLIGDQLWVKETHWRWGYWEKRSSTDMGKEKWKFIGCDCGPYPVLYSEPSFPLKAVDRSHLGYHKRPSIFMPRWASRIQLEVQDITTADIRAEGVDDGRTNPSMGKRHDASMRIMWESLWNSINAERGFGWDVNPWVWIVCFKLLQPSQRLRLDRREVKS